MKSCKITLEGKSVKGKVNNFRDVFKLLGKPPKFYENERYTIVINKKRLATEQDLQTERIDLKSVDFIKIVEGETSKGVKLFEDVGIAVAGVATVLATGGAGAGFVLGAAHVAGLLATSYGVGQVANDAFGTGSGVLSSRSKNAPKHSPAVPKNIYNPKKSGDSPNIPQGMKSNFFNSTVNVATEGGTVPIVYGEMLVGSVVASSTVTAQNGETLTINVNEPSSSNQSVKESTRTETVLTSDSVLNIVDVISEGEIQGLVDGDNSVLFDNKSVNGLEGVTYEIKNGSPNQEPLSGYNMEGQEIPQGITITNSTPHTFVITDDQVDFVNIKIQVNQLFSIDPDTQAENGSSLEFEISYGGTKKIEALILSEYLKGYLIDVSNLTKPLSITIEKITEDITDLSTGANDFGISSYTLLYDSPIRYADTAVIGLTIDAKEFGSTIPNRSYKIRGKKLNIPSNYDPEKRTYSGLWDGTFKIQYSNNPAWVIYDLLTNSRYGMGKYIKKDMLNLDRLYEIAQYCDDTIQGKPRHTFNGTISAQENGYDLLKKIMATYAITLYVRGSRIDFYQDRPRDTTAIVTPSNVVDGLFSYSTGDYYERASTVLVSFTNQNNTYQQDIETVRDLELISEGVDNKKTIFAYGITERHYAHKYGLQVLLSDLKNFESVQYTAGLDHSLVDIGDVIQIADPELSESVQGGRVKSFNGLEIQLDREFEFISGETYTIHIISDLGGIESGQIINPATTTDTINIVGSFPSNFTGFPVFYITRSTDNEAQKYTILSIEEEAPQEFRITAAKYEGEKFEALEQNDPLNYTEYKTNDNFTAKPTGISIRNKTTFLEEGVLKNSLSFGWKHQNNAYKYEYQYKINNRPFTQLETSSLNSATILGVSGAYTFRVRSIDILGNRSAFSTYRTSQNLDKTPEDVKNFRYHRSGSDITFSWSLSEPYEKPYISHYEVRRGLVWDTSAKLFETISNSYVYSSNSGGTFLIKAVSITGQASTNATETQVFDAPTNIILETDHRAEGWTGTRTDFTETDGDLLFTVDDYPNLWATYTDLWSSYTKPYVGKPLKGDVATYETQTIDLEEVITVFINTETEYTSQPEDFTWPAFSGYYWPDLKEWSWLGRSDAASFKVFIKTSDDNITEDVREFVAGQYKARYITFIVQMTAKESNYEYRLKEFKTSIDVPDITEKARVVTNSEGYARYDYTNFFHEIPVVSHGIVSSLEDAVTSRENLSGEMKEDAFVGETSFILEKWNILPPFQMFAGDILINTVTGATIGELAADTLFSSGDELTLTLANPLTVEVEKDSRISIRSKKYTVIETYKKDDLEPNTTVNLLIRGF